MLFSSMFFLWAFLPLIFVLYRIIKNHTARNYLLLAFSLIFYAWGEPKFIVLMLLSITINYLSGLLIDRFRRYKVLILICSIAFNLALLGYFKYFNFFTEILLGFTGNEITFAQIALPIGISFYTFQAMSYVIDLFRGTIKVQKNYMKLALYISFFPQLIAGPIVKYRDIDAQIDDRQITPQKTAYGIRRFVLGLAKKVIISNAVALVVDNIYLQGTENVSTSLAWVAAICYMIQIYFDFSGYSDMAIGLGQMFGFKFLENFNYPYISKSIQEFWRRWHISLSTWFKEYVYIPLGGNRKSALRTYINLTIVFLLTGLWHGASWSFVIWGLYNGLFLIIERLFLAKLLDRCRLKFINVIYSMFVVLIGWVIFRAETLTDAKNMLGAMFTPTVGDPALSVGQFFDGYTMMIVVIGFLLCGWLQLYFKGFKHQLYDDKKTYKWEYPVVFGLFILCIILISSNSYNPFIYFRF